MSADSHKIFQIPL